MSKGIAKGPDLPDVSIAGIDIFGTIVVLTNSGIAPTAENVINGAEALGYSPKQTLAAIAELVAADIIEQNSNPGLGRLQ